MRRSHTPRGLIGPRLILPGRDETGIAPGPPGGHGAAGGHGATGRHGAAGITQAHGTLGEHHMAGAHGGDGADRKAPLAGAERQAPDEAGAERQAPVGGADRTSRRTLLAGLGASALLTPLPRTVRAQSETPNAAQGEAAAPPREGRGPFTIMMITWRGWEDASQGFKDYLDRRGVPTELIVRDASRSAGNVAEAVAEAKEIRPDLLYTWGTTTALTAFGRTGEVDPERHVTDIPSVFTIVSDPVGSGLVTAFDAPRANLTGTLYIAPIETQLRTIEAYGAFDTLGAVFNADEANARLTMAAIEEIGAREGFSVIARPVARIEGGPQEGKPDPERIGEAVRAVKAQGADWLYIPPDSFLNVNRERLTEAALDAQLPSFASAENFVRGAKGLLGLVSRYYNVGQFTGYVAEQILLGRASPGMIPIESLDRFSLLVNMATARALGFYPPMSMLTIAEFTET